MNNSVRGELGKKEVAFEKFGEERIKRVKGRVRNFREPQVKPVAENRQYKTVEDFENNVEREEAKWELTEKESDSGVSLGNE